MKKLIFKIIKITLIIATIILAYIVISGYVMYKMAVSNISVAEKVEKIKSRENYDGNISDYFYNAVISIEDNRFETHNGFDLKSFLRANLENLKRGELYTGGSTITQQLAKNMYFTSKKKLSRKVAELFVVHELEKKYSKRDIFNLYVNIIYYGDGYTGIKEASLGYFNQLPKDLNLYNASLLAGILPAPSSYELSNNNVATFSRQYLVLNAMYLYKKINKSEYKENADIVDIYISRED